MSTPQKFGALGIKKSTLAKKPLLQSHCFRGVYTYLITSVNEQDARDPVSGFVDRNARVRVMETLDDMRDVRGYYACHHNDVPEYFPVSDEGFEKQYAFKMTQGGRAAIDLIVEEPSYVRIIF